MKQRNQYIGIGVFCIGVVIIGIAYAYSWRDVFQRLSRIDVPRDSEQSQELEREFENIQASIEILNQKLEQEGEDPDIQLEDESPRAENLTEFEQAIQEANLLNQE